MARLSFQLVVTAALALFSTGSCQTRPTVTFSNGPVIGTTTVVSSASATVTKYVGIPFASNPPLRFAAPSPAPSWTKPLDASTTKPACFQQFFNNATAQVFNNPLGTPPAESEDCLYLNVYVPPGTTASSGLPVMFWIFGGNLQFGTGFLNFYDGSSFAANQKVIVVTPNYRTNIHAFSGSPEIPASSRNAGFLDQRLALRWVNQNIRFFGGDPNKVTIFGESAGGKSVEQFIAYPPKPSQFRAAILESPALAAISNSTASWYQAAALLGCGTASSVLACMRTKSALDIKYVIQNNTIDFSPISDGATYTPDIRPLLDSGVTAKVPVMMGTNADEGRVFAYILGLNGPNPNTTAAINSFFGNNPATLALFNSLSNLGATPYYAVAEFITKLAFQCVVRQFSGNLHDHAYSTYRYYFNASFPNINTFGPSAGAYHTAEIPEVFGTYPTKNALGSATAQQIALSKYMQTAWANFAKNGNPGADWPEVGAAAPLTGSRKVQDLGGNGANNGFTIDSASIDQACVLYDAFITANGY